jgi:hypothetical protein
MSGQIAAFGDAGKEGLRFRLQSRRQMGQKQSTKS